MRRDRMRVELAPQEVRYLRGVLGSLIHRRELRWPGIAREIARKLANAKPALRVPQSPFYW